MDASHGGGVRADRIMVAVTVPGVAPEAVADIRKACEALEQEASRLSATGDPIATMISVFAGSAGAINRLLVDATVKMQAQQEATGKLIQDSRKPWTRDEMRALITQLDQTLLHRWSQFNRAGIAIGVGVALLFGAACGAGGWFARGDVPALAGVHAGAERCQDQANGGRLCWIPIWERLPTSK